MPKIYERKCDFCNKQYKGTPKKFCSWQCYLSTKSGKRKIKCIICGKERWVKFHLSKTAKFCSRECYYKDPERRKRMLGNKLGTGQKKGATWKLSEETKAKHRLLKGKLSPMWGKKHSKATKIKLKKSWTKERRREWAKKWSGKNCNFWKGGLSTKNSLIRVSFNYRIWRKSVFERDNYICQMCNQKGNYLQAHHIQNFANYPQLRFETNNGITFCKNCHKTFHKQYGIKNTNKEHLNKFLN